MFGLFAKIHNHRIPVQKTLLTVLIPLKFKICSNYPDGLSNQSGSQCILFAVREEFCGFVLQCDLNGS